MVPKDTARVARLESVSIAIHEKTYVIKLRVLRWELVQDYQRHTKYNACPWKRETEKDSAYQHKKALWPWRQRTMCLRQASAKQL